MGVPPRFVARTEQDMNEEPIAWMILEDGICILITRREQERDEWIKAGCAVVPLYTKKAE